jgi:hypothetical protein
LLIEARKQLQPLDMQKHNHPKQHAFGKGMIDTSKTGKRPNRSHAYQTSSQGPQQNHIQYNEFSILPLSGPITF